MEKNYNNKDPKIHQKRIEKLSEDEFKEILEKYDIDLEKSEICDLAEFLIINHPEKYARTIENENNYRRDEKLQKVLAIINKEKNIAVIVNTEEGNVPKGEFGVYDLENHKFEASEIMKDKIRKKLEKISNGTLTAKEQEELIKKISPQNLDDMDKLVTIDNELDNRVKKSMIEKINEKNKENGISEEEKDKVEQKENSKNKVKLENDEKQDIPENVRNACKKLGITKLKSFFYVKANELDKRVDDTLVNKYGNNVLILEVPDSDIEGPNKYYGFQDEKMVLYGREETNDSVKNITGNVTKMGKILSPLKLEEEQYFEYKDSQGLEVKEKIDDKSDLSDNQIKQYKIKMEETFEKYSQNVYSIKQDNTLSEESKIERISAVKEWCEITTTDLSIQNNISQNNDKNIDSVTEEHTEEIKEEIIEDELDDEQSEHMKRVRRNQTFNNN